MPNHRSRASRGLLAGLLALAGFASGAVALVSRQSSTAQLAASTPVTSVDQTVADGDGEHDGAAAVRTTDGGRGHH